jgi:hypothetical protein
MVTNYSQETPHVLFSSHINKDEFRAEEKEKVGRERKQKIKAPPQFSLKKKRKTSLAFQKTLSPLKKQLYPTSFILFFLT